MDKDQSFLHAFMFFFVCGLILFACDLIPSFALASVRCSIDNQTQVLRPNYFNDESNPTISPDQVKPFAAGLEIADTLAYKDASGADKTTAIHYKVLQATSLQDDNPTCPDKIPTDTQFTTERHIVFATKFQFWADDPTALDTSNIMAEDIQTPARAEAWGICDEDLAKICLPQ